MKDRGYQIAPLALVLLLAGCFGGDVGKVKDSKMKGWPQYKVSQLLDKRKICSETKWRSFTDTRDRKIVEYTCDYAQARAYLQKSTDDWLADIEKSKQVRAENDASQLALKRRSYEEAVDSHKELLASQEELGKTGSPAMQALAHDRATLETISSCANIKPDAFLTEEVKFRAQELSRQCDRRDAMLPPLESLRRTIDSRWNDRQRLHARQVEDFPRRVMGSEANVRMYKADLDRLVESIEGEQVGNNRDVKTQSWLAARLAAFQGVKELSQWVIIDGEPTYLGSRVDTMFENQPVEVPVDASFVFGKAADDPADLTPLHEHLLKQALNQFKDPSAN